MVPPPRRADSLELKLRALHFNYATLDRPIGKTGHLQSDSGGASFWAQSNVLFNNSGRVNGGFEILFSHSATINNSGVIDSTGATWALRFGDGRHQI